MTSAARANRNADIVDRLEAENERLRDALTQIAAVCNDNAQVSDQGKGMALYLVHQIAGAALAPTGKERG